MKINPRKEKPLDSDNQKQRIQALLDFYRRIEQRNQQLNDR